MSRFSIKRPMTVLVAVILVIILGVVSFSGMKTDLLPSINLPYAVIMTTYVGANPETVEERVTKPIEQSMSTISNIVQVSSVSSENYSLVILEFSGTANMDSATIDINMNLDTLTAAWGEGIGSPIVLKLNPDMLPVLVAAVDVDGLDQKELSAYVDHSLLARIESVEGAASVDVSGMVEEKIHVVLNKEKIKTLNETITNTYIEMMAGMMAMGPDAAAAGEMQGQDLSAGNAAASAMDVGSMITEEMVSNILMAQNFSMPVGYLTENGLDYLVRVGDKIQDVEEIKSLILFQTGIPGIEPVTLDAVADVFMVDNASEIYAKVNGNDALILSIQKQNSYSTTEVAQSVKERFQQIMDENPSVHATYLLDQGMYIDVVVDSVLNNLIYGAILAVIILFLFLWDLRPTFIVAVSIPISVIFAVVLMYFSGVTLNIISLSGLAVGVGMLVDNSIVVIENIYRLRNKGISAVKSAITGAKQVAGAITSSTLTTVCVFLPIVFVEGITRQLFVDMGLTVAYSLLASLIVALTVVPAMSANMLKKAAEKKHPLMDRVSSIYEKSIRFGLKHKAFVLLLAVAFLAGSVVLSMSRGTAFMPSMDSTQISVSVEMPEGALFDEITETADEIMQRIQTIKDVDTVGASVGGSLLGGLMGGGGSNSLSIYVILKEDKNSSSEQIAAKIDALCADMEAEVDASGSVIDMSALGGSGLSYQIKGEDLTVLQDIAGDIAGLLRNVEGTADVSDGMENPSPEVKITVDKNKAAMNGLYVGQIMQEIAGLLSGTQEATSIHYNTIDYPVLVFGQEDADSVTKERIENYEFTVTDASGARQVRLADVAEVTDTFSLSSISRNANQRLITVSAAVADGYNIGLVSQDADKAVNAYAMPAGYEITSAGEDETINEALFELVKMLLLAVAFIYLIMVAQFQSLLSPFIIMFTIPLAFTGGFIGLFITGNEVSVISMIGFVMLSGIIVNNGIVLVDYIIQLRREGMDTKEAIVDAGKTRMRPIFMTALTTIFGLSTMALGLGMGADMVQPIAIVTIGGLLYATITTLYVVPVLYAVFNRKKLRVVSEEELAEYEENA